MSLTSELEAIASETDFSGVAMVSLDGKPLVELARGLADRTRRAPIEMDSIFGTASATKGFTALATVSLVESGQLSLDATAQSLIGDVLPMVDPAVTIEHLLAHTSGIGDYLDEDELGDIDDEVLSVPAEALREPNDYLRVLGGHPQLSEPGTRFKYNNSGYVLLSIMIEAATGHSYYDMVRELVLDKAGMSDTSFRRSDRLPARAALGYLGSGDTNVRHLPVRGAGDGGCYSTVADMERFWSALLAGQIVSASSVHEMLATRSLVPSERAAYGLGFWLRPDGETVFLEGRDAGVSFRSAHDMATGLTYTVISNTSTGVWPLVNHIDSVLPDISEPTT